MRLQRLINPTNSTKSAHLADSRKSITWQQHSKAGQTSTAQAVNRENIFKLDAEDGLVQLRTIALTFVYTIKTDSYVKRRITQNHWMVMQYSS